MTDDERIIREALAAGPTPGPWHAVGTFISDGSYAKGHVRREEDATYIACCSPDRIERVLTELERLRAELAGAKRDAERYRWLRDIGDRTWPPFSKRAGCSRELIDAAIDKSIAAIDRARLGIPYKPAVAQWTEQGSSIPAVEGSNPSRRANTSKGDA